METRLCVPAVTPAPRRVAGLACLKWGLALLAALGLWLLVRPAAVHAETIPVTNTLDSGAGSLRQAVADAAPGDTVVFAPALSGQKITLNSPIEITRNLTIDGSGLGVPVVIDGNDATRLFKVSGGAQVTFAYLTLAHGCDTGSECWDVSCGGGIKLEAGAGVTLVHSTLSENSAGWGGGIFNDGGALTIQYSTLSGNSATCGDWSCGGGAIYSYQGGLTITHSTLSGNSAARSGGGIRGWQSTALLIDSTLSGNSAGGYGGGVYSDRGVLHALRSTLSGNSAERGGAILSYDGSAIALLNSTLSGNSAADYGGGVYIERNDRHSVLEVIHSTISANQADYGGGLHSGEFYPLGSTAAITLENSIVAGNVAGLGADCRGDSFVSQGYNLVGTGTGCPSDGAGDQTTGDAGLAALADNGGHTWTHAVLLPDSPALDAIPYGQNGCGVTYTDDQRGAPRPFPNLGACDVGAYEAPQVVLHLPLNEAYGASTFADVSGYGYYGECFSNFCPTAAADGKLYRSTRFDGTNDYIEVSGLPALTTYSLSLWFWWDDLYSSEIDFLTARGMTNMELHTGGGAGVDGLRFIPAGNGTLVDASGVIALGWNHVAATYDGSAAYLYVNGALVGSRTGITGGNDLSTDSGTFFVGQRADGTFPFEGAIDDVRLYQRVLSAREVADLAAAVPDVGVAPARLDFGAQDMGAGATPSQSIVVGNTGLGDVHVSAVTLAGDTTQFGLIDSGQATITPGATRTLTVTFDPDSPGRKVMTVTVASDDPDEGTLAVSVTGIGGMSLLTVTITADTDDGACDAHCSLREAIALAIPGATIGFDPGLAGQTIALGGQLEISSSLIVDGSPLSTPVIVDGNGTTRLLRVFAGDVTLAHLALAHGHDSSADCWSDPCGGAIKLDPGASLTLTHSSILSSTAGTAGIGGAIHNGGVLAVLHSTLSGNLADAGGAIFNRGGSLTIQDSLLAGNSAPGWWGNGGAIHNDEGELHVLRSRLADNGAKYEGGAVYNFAGELTLSHSTLSGNGAGENGGAISSREAQGTLSIQHSVVANNYTTRTWGCGGGVWSGSETLLVSNSTLSGNRAGEDGGGIFSSSGVLTLTHSTITGNQGDSDGSPYDGGGGLSISYSTATLHNNLIAGNVDASTPGSGDCHVYHGVLASQGYNMVGVGTGCTLSGPGDITTPDPRLAALADNSGATWTHALLPDSPAIDAGDPADCSAVDQRDLPRADLRCDIGAFELRHADSDTVVRGGFAAGVPYSFGPTWISVTLSAADSGSITVTKHLTYPGGIADPGEMRAIWSIGSSLSDGLPLTLGLCYTDDEVAGLDEGALRAYRWDTGALTWTLPISTGLAVDESANCVTLAGIEGFSAWTLFDTSEEPARPTVVTLREFGARSAALSPGLFALGVALLVLGSGAAFRRRRSSTGACPPHGRNSISDRTSRVLKRKDSEG